jgi:protein transport protein SEC20
MYRTNEQPDQRVLLSIQSTEQRIVQLDTNIKNDIEQLASTTHDSQRHVTLAVTTIKAKCNQMRAQIKLLADVAHKVHRALDKADLTEQVSKHSAELDNNGARLRTAVVNALNTLEATNRNSLFSDTSGAHRRNLKTAAMNNEMEQGTQKLSELLSRMNDQVEQSGQTLGTLVDSSAMINSTEQEFHSMSATVQVSSKLLSKYSRREFTDKMLFALTVLFFFGTVFYIVKQRLIPGSLSLW